MRDHDQGPSYASRRLKKQAPAAALRRTDPILRGPRPEAEATGKGECRAAAPRRELDDRPVLAAYDLIDEAGEVVPVPVISAAANFSLLVFHDYRYKKRRVVGFTSHPVIGWRLCHGGASPLPLCFDHDAKYAQMCDCAVQNPDGTVTSFEGHAFKSAASWLRDRRRVLGRRR